MPALVRCRVQQARISLSRVQRLAEQVLAALGESTAELSLDLVGDGQMRRLNREYRRKDAPTDVLAFPMREAAGPASSLLGDVVISLPTAGRQAAAHGHSVDLEVAMLRRILVSLAVIVLLVAAGLYAVGRGALGRHEEPGEVNEQRRSPGDVAARTAAQDQAAAATAVRHAP